MPGSDDSTDPLWILRLVLSGLLIFGTVVALVLGLTGIAPKALLLAGGLWGAYGVARAAVSGVLAPGTELVGELFANGGVDRIPSEHSEIQALAAQGRYQDASERWWRQVVDGEAPATAILKRAELLAGPLNEPGTAASELTLYRDAPRLPLTPAEDVGIGLALVDLYEHRLQDPARAMYELRRLLDRYPQTRHVRLIRAALNDLKERRFGDAFTPGSHP
jgi:hypothetical protein